MRNKLKNKLGSSMYDNFAGGNGAPIYDSSGRVIRSKREKRKKMVTKIIIISLVFAVLGGVIYLPQFFMKSDNKGKLIMEPDRYAYTDLVTYVKNHSGDDFDKDGLNNYSEYTAGANPFDPDTDRDGMPDGSDSEPLSAGDYLYRAILSKGNDMKTPYEINGVILWPDNKGSWTNGAVIEVQSGYQFTNFEGWAKFPDGKYAYQYVDGKHTILPYRESANAWHITQDCVVVLTDNKPEDTYEISLFGNKFYLRNQVGKALSAILPDAGWICASTMWLDDTFVETKPYTYSNFTKVDVSQYHGQYYNAYSKDLAALSEVYELIDNGYYVLASLMSEDAGECIVEVYGYTYSGDLIVADPMRKSSSGLLEIDVCCSRYLSDTNVVTERAWFEYAGCGYDSTQGALISFFAANPAAKD